MRIKAVVTGALGVCAVCMAFCASASATSNVIWGWDGCIAVPSGRGGWEAGCRIPHNGGSFARAILSLSGLLHACIWMGLLAGMLDDPGCVFLGGTFGYVVFADPPTLTVKIKGGPYKLKGKIAGVALTVGCTSMEAKEAEMESDGSTTAGRLEAASLLYTGCSVEAPKNCEVNSAGQSSGTIATNAVEAELVENAAKTKVENLFKPKSGTIFSELEFKKEECGFKTIGKVALLGSTLTLGGAEDEIANAKEYESEGKEKEEDGEDVEKPKLISEPASKNYLNDATEAEAEAKLTIAGSAATLTGEATEEAKFSGGAFKSEESMEEVTVAEGPVDMGIEKE